MQVKDMFGSGVSFIQDEHSVKSFNDLFNEDYTYYFIKPLEGCLDQIYGCYRAFMSSNVYYVGEII